MKYKQGNYIQLSRVVFDEEYKHMSDSAKQRCAEGRHRKESVVRVSLDNSEVVYYEKIDDAVKEGFTGPSIVKVCKGRLNKHKDYK